jgi:uncharacterized protein (DUF433 family)
MGAYTADRAAALSGVPKSTVHYWAREGILVPSISPTKVRLWSYSDLMGLRTVYWLRQKKTHAAGGEIPPTSMPLVRRALGRLRELGEPVWDPTNATIWVDEAGGVHVRNAEGAEPIAEQRWLPGALNLVAPFATAEGLSGPDLIAPRPQLRIVPTKLSGSPHIVGTRLETRAIAALAWDGLPTETLQSLYPFVTLEQIAQAIALEDQLEANLRVSAAA